MRLARLEPSSSALSLFMKRRRFASSAASAADLRGGPAAARVETAGGVGAGAREGSTDTSAGAGAGAGARTDAAGAAAGPGAAIAAPGGAGAATAATGAASSTAAAAGGAIGRAAGAPAPAAAASPGDAEPGVTCKLGRAVLSPVGPTVCAGAASIDAGDVECVPSSTTAGPCDAVCSEGSG